MGKASDVRVTYGYFACADWGSGNKRAMDESTSGSRMRALSLLDAYAHFHHEGSHSLKAAMWNLTKARRSQNRGTVHFHQNLVATDLRLDLNAQLTLGRCLPDVEDDGVGDDQEESINKKNKTNQDEPDLIKEPVKGSTSGVIDRPFFQLIHSQQPKQLLPNTIQDSEKENVVEVVSKLSSSPAAAMADTMAPSALNVTQTQLPSFPTGLRQRRAVAAASNEQKHVGEGPPDATTNTLGHSNNNWAIESLTSTSAGSTILREGDDITGGINITTYPRTIDPLELFGGGLAPRELRSAQEQARNALDAFIQAANLRMSLEHLLDQHAPVARE